jgi:hypothetical protein
MSRGRLKLEALQRPECRRYELCAAKNGACGVDCLNQQLTVLIVCGPRRWHWDPREIRGQGTAPSFVGKLLAAYFNSICAGAIGALRNGTR